jgi:hypothetical protein
MAAGEEAERVYEAAMKVAMEQLETIRPELREAHRIWHKARHKRAMYSFLVNGIERRLAAGVSDPKERAKLEESIAQYRAVATRALERERAAEPIVSRATPEELRILRGMNVCL